ncbi:MAG TPA: hypothetical protein VE956_14725 [Nodularia sp. (in: cyanobacteria)]|nr:hypothetical protein [Nodularia sp. (in: cyanobacteria)]
MKVWRVERSLVLTRAGYAIVQPWAAVWMGDKHIWKCLFLPMLFGVGEQRFPDDCRGRSLKC